MKKLLFFLIIITAFFASCGDNRTPKNEITHESLNLTSDSIIIDHIKNLTYQVDSLNNQNQILKEKIDNSKAEKYFMWLAIGAGIGFLALLVAIVALFQAFTRDEYINRVETQKDKIYGLDQRIRHLESQGTVSPSRSRNHCDYAPVSEDFTSLSGKVEKLEESVTDIKNKLLKITGKVSTGPSTGNGGEGGKTTIETGYLGTPISSGNKVGFSEILPSKTDKAFFKISYKNDKEGTFELLDLKSIKSVDWVEKVIETSGKCTIPEASAFTLEKTGRVVKQDDYWIVESKLKIKLQK